MEGSQMRQAFMYLIKNAQLPIVKVGFWSGTICDLKKRYQTYYDKNCVIHYFDIDHKRIHLESGIFVALEVQWVRKQSSEIFENPELALEIFTNMAKLWGKRVLVYNERQPMSSNMGWQETDWPTGKSEDTDDQQDRMVLQDLKKEYSRLLTKRKIVQLHKAIERETLRIPEKQASLSETLVSFIATTYEYSDRHIDRITLQQILEDIKQYDDTLLVPREGKMIENALLACGFPKLKLHRMGNRGGITACSNIIKIV